MREPVHADADEHREASRPELSFTHLAAPLPRALYAVTKLPELRIAAREFER
ncbi:MAG: hypothetical protein ACLPYS_05150 [Vulcanimicrobiaceae bacterium]